MQPNTAKKASNAAHQIARDAVNLHVAWVKRHRTSDNRCEVDLDELFPAEAIALGSALYDALHDLGCRVRVDEEDETVITVQVPWRGIA